MISLDVEAAYVSNTLTLHVSDVETEPLICAEEFALLHCCSDVEV
jgi:hypothetical protein